MKVYHGSTLEIKHPIAAAGREKLDFGCGFYVSDIKGQAETWAKQMCHFCRILSNLKPC